MSARSAGSRVLHTLAYAPPDGLPVRHWRLIWLSIPARLLIALPVSCVLIPLYLLAKGLAWACDEVGGLFSKLYVTLYNRDLARSGWTRPPRYGQTIRLNPKWEARRQEGTRP